MHDTDLLGYCILRPNAQDQLLLPLWPGSSFADSRAYEVSGTASNVYGSVNATQLVRHPVFYLRCPVFTAWFNPTTLLQMFGRQYGSGEIVGRDRIGNYSGSLGSIQWRYSTQPAIQYAACKVQTMVLSWSGAGQPLEAWLAIRPYGWRQVPQGFLSGQYTGRPWHGQQMSHFHTGVWSGLLRVENNLVPNDSSPHFASYDGSLYAVDYTSAPYDAAVQVVQAAGGVTVDNLYSDIENSFTFVFQDPTQTQQVRCQLNVLQPDRVETVRGGNGMVTRTYAAIKYDAAGTRLRFY